MCRIRLILMLSGLCTSHFLYGQGLSPDFYDRLDGFWGTYVHEGRVDYARVQREQATVPWVAELASARLQDASAAGRQAFLINAYNLLVIHAAAEAYPIASVLDVAGFFDRTQYQVAGQSMTLNELEKIHLLSAFGDRRFHFVLVCGAVDCPPIAPTAYRPELLEQQLQARTAAALNDPGFVRVADAQQLASLSQIFEWYAGDFGVSTSSALDYVNSYRRQPVPVGYTLNFYAYDWSLNNWTEDNGIPQPAAEAGVGPANAIRYVVSATIPRGQVETKLFNNLYTQVTGNGTAARERSTFFTTFISSLYGVSHRFNAGLELRYRRVRNESLPSSALSVLGPMGMAQTREGLTSIGPKIRWAPAPRWPNFSIQSALWIPLERELEGGGGKPYIDWNGPAWWTQFFNDFTLGSRFSLFTEIDLLWEDIGKGPATLNRISTPATVILSYFPRPKTTLYTLGGYSPYWNPSYDYFAQAGLGAKQQISRKLEFELLCTWFTNSFLQRSGGRAATFNLGVRFNLG
ncbi:MAG: DUF547 domain-containing protein [Bacteroidia bacterium]|nr:DUF547 domain-containing protein [Bacteroidia bacterium]